MWRPICLPSVLNSSACGAAYFLSLSLFPATYARLSRLPFASSRLFALAVAASMESSGYFCAAFAARFQFDFFSSAVSYKYCCPSASVRHSIRFLLPFFLPEQHCRFLFRRWFGLLLLDPGDAVGAALHHRRRVEGRRPSGRFEGVVAPEGGGDPAPASAVPAGHALRRG